MKRENQNSHPRLRTSWKTKSYDNHLISSSEFDSLVSICEALFPPLDYPPSQIDDNDHHYPTNHSIKSFFQSSASQYPIPNEVVEVMKDRGLPEAVILVRLVLWLISTRLGTFLLCGYLCLGKEWPYITKFSHLPTERREKILQNWSSHKFFSPLRLVFYFLKSLCLYFYFSLVDENCHNPAWEAIDYKPDTTTNSKTINQERPLENGIVETLYETPSTLLQALTSKGLSAKEDPQDDVYKIKCDVVIVGSGCGGGVAAAVLAGAGQKVVVLEKGNYYTAPDYSSLEGPSMDELLQKGGMIPSTDGAVVLLAGSAVGGGTAVNWSAALRTPEPVLQEWKRGKRCKGVLASSINDKILKKIQIEAKVTISACGSLLTPPLLKTSGLKNKHIGKNLHLHPSLLVWGYFPPEGPTSKLEGKCYEGGLITSAHRVVTDQSSNCSPRALIETPALGPAACAALRPWESGSSIKRRMIRYSRTAHLFVMVRDKGSGEVKSEQRITYRLTSEDRENMTAGLRRALQILIAAGAVEVGTYRSDGQSMECKGKSDEEIEEFLGSVSATRGPLTARFWGVYCTAHQMGSCRMGRSESDGAVDENGESWEAEGLFVCDGSVLPSAVGVNPMITIQSTAYCIAKRLAESLKNGEFNI
ncbi:Long-chain-alcohol oxidase FAO4B [Bienertia sinuspersici]